MLTNEHERIQDLFFALLDDSISQADRREVEEHVASCAACAEELRVTRATTAMVSTLSDRPLPDGFLARFQERLAAEPPLAPESREVEGAVPASPQSNAKPHGESRVTQCDQEGVSRLQSPAAQAVESPEVAARVALDRQAAERQAAVTRLAPVPPRRRSWRTSTAFRAVSSLAACLVTACGLVLFSWCMQPAEPTLAVLEWTSADLSLSAGDGTRTSTVKAAQSLRLGDVLESGAEARSVMRLGASGSIRLDTNTRVAVVALGASNEGTFMKLQLDRGAVWVEDTPGARCVVQTRAALVVPAGTVYEVRVHDGTTNVDVWEGQVDLQATTPNRTSATSGRLDAGQRAEVSPTQPQVKVGLVDRSRHDRDSWVQWNRRLEPPTPVAPQAPLASPGTRSLAPPNWVASPPACPTWGVAEKTPPGTAGEASSPSTGPSSASAARRTPAIGTPPGGQGGPGSPPAAGTSRPAQVRRPPDVDLPGPATHGTGLRRVQPVHPASTPRHEEPRVIDLPAPPMPTPSQRPTAGQDPGQGSTPGHGQAPGPGATPGQGQGPGHGQAPGPGATPGQGQGPGQPSPRQWQRPWMRRFPSQGQGNERWQRPGQGQTPGQWRHPGHSSGSGQGQAPGQWRHPGGSSGSGQGQTPGQWRHPGHSSGSGQGQAPGQWRHPGQSSGSGQGQAPGQWRQHPRLGQPSTRPSASLPGTSRPGGAGRGHSWGTPSHGNGSARHRTP